MAMHLGAFSISLSVKDIQVSKAFYEALGFTVFGGKLEQNWLIMKNGNALIGLFQGMFEGNMLTFNPKWNESGETIDGTPDVRDIQRHLQDADISLTRLANDQTSGPDYITLTDPDGNNILIDQHV